MEVSATIVAQAFRPALRVLAALKGRPTYVLIAAGSAADSAACFTSGESGLSCAACCSAADARSHSPRAIVALATPTHASTRVGSSRVARPKLSSAPAGFFGSSRPSPARRWRGRCRGSQRSAVLNACAAPASSPPRQRISPLVSCARPERRVQRERAIGRGARLGEIVLFQVSGREVDVRLEALGLLRPRPASSIAMPSSSLPAATYTSPR